jgi:hypothetical protein
MTSKNMNALTALALAVALIGLGVPGVAAQEAAAVQVTVKNRHFQPAEVSAPANKPLTLTVRNLDATPMEFESVTLRVEKVVAGNSSGIIRLRPLAPGRYKFFDDFNPSSQGVLVVK